jgi:hypothetical protein
VYQHSPSALQALANEAVGGGEVLEEILVVRVVHTHNHMFVGCKQLPVKGNTEHRQDMSDVGPFQSFLATQREDAVCMYSKQTEIGRALAILRCNVSGSRAPHSPPAGRIARHGELSAEQQQRRRNVPPNVDVLIAADPVQERHSQSREAAQTAVLVVGGRGGRAGGGRI